jgi:HPt (histidine-containing phosphotransfer) domain-containing protein
LEVDLIFDKSVFLSRLEGDAQLATEVIALFLDECPKLLASTREAAERRDAPGLERAAHRLKGAVGDIAAPQAFNAARKLEQRAREKNLEDAEAALESLEDALHRLVHELHDLQLQAA